jgi:hypothetical protein
MEQRDLIPMDPFIYMRVTLHSTTQQQKKESSLQLLYQTKHYGNGSNRKIRNFTLLTLNKESKYFF